MSNHRLGYSSRRVSSALRGLFLTSTALAGVVAPLTGSDRASAACIGVDFSVFPNIQLTCTPPGVATTNAIPPNPLDPTTPSPPPSYPYTSIARNQQFDANIEAIISPGAAITGAGLTITALGTTPHTIDVTNNGSVSLTDTTIIGDGLRIQGNGGTITYSGIGSASTVTPISGWLLRGSSFLTKIAET